MLAGILAVGWAAALGIYATAEPVEENPDIADLEQTKGYQRQLEVIGGKAAVVGARLADGWDGLWHGQRLAYTVGVLTALAAGAYALWDRGRPGAGSSPHR